jgi:hypothetical protein
LKASDKRFEDRTMTVLLRDPSYPDPTSSPLIDDFLNDFDRDYVLSNSFKQPDKDRIWERVEAREANQRSVEWGGPHPLDSFRRF